MYDAVAGRFASRDSIGYVAGPNLYSGTFAPSKLDPSGNLTVTYGPTTQCSGPSWKECNGNICPKKCPEHHKAKAVSCEQRTVTTTYYLQFWTGNGIKKVKKTKQDIEISCKCKFDEVPACTAERLRELYKKQTEDCDKANNLGSCQPGMSFDAMQARIDAWTSCFGSRSAVAHECWRGGDTGHKVAIIQAAAVVSNCIHMQSGWPMPEPYPVPQGPFNPSMPPETCTGTIRCY
jgi:hypothetical protein